MPFQYTTLSFQAFTPEQLYAYLQLRSEVFVVEQNCVYQDLDNLDQDSLHVLVYDAQRALWRQMKNTPTFLSAELLSRQHTENKILAMH